VDLDPHVSNSGRGNRFVSYTYRLDYRLRAVTRPTTTHHSHILSVDLRRWRAPEVASSLEVEFRTASPDDAEVLTWGHLNGEAITEQMLVPAAGNRYTCYVATVGNAVVGCSWTWHRGFDCRYLGVRLDWPEDTCYGGDMFVNPEYREKHVGLGLLVHGLLDARARGYTRKVCWVLAHNHKMLGAIGQLGYRITGQIRRTGWFPLHGSRFDPVTNGFFERFSSVTWESKGRTGRGSPIVL
jgi:GNAT superfamily N-acetyltransferase